MKERGVALGGSGELGSYQPECRGPRDGSGDRAKPRAREAAEHDRNVGEVCRAGPHSSKARGGARDRAKAWRKKKSGEEDRQKEKDDRWVPRDILWYHFLRDRLEMLCLVNWGSWICAGALWGRPV